MKNLKRIIYWYTKNRLWFFFISCIFVFVTFLFLHGSVYRYVIYPPGLGRIIPRDARSNGTYQFYLVLAIITCVVQLFSIIPYLIIRKKISNKEFYSFVITQTLFFGVILASIITLGIYYV